MDAPSLTPKQAKVLHYITTILDRTGVAPTQSEIGEYISVTKITAREHVMAIEKKGYITKETDKARAITPTELGWRWHNDRAYCPIIESIAAEIISVRCATIASNRRQTLPENSF